MRERSGRLQQQPLVAVEGGEMREHLHGRVGRAEHGNARLLQELASGDHTRFAHPAGDERFGRAARRFRDHARDLFGIGHRLRSEYRQHPVDALVGQAGGDGGAIAFTTRVSDKIDRIAVRPVGRKHAAQFFHGCGGKLGECEAEIRGAVGRHDTRTAAVGDHRQPAPLRAQARSERLRRSDQLPDAAYPHHARALDRGVEHVVGPDDGAGVRNRRARSRGVAADLHDDDRLHARRRAQAREKAPRIAYALDV